MSEKTEARIRWGILVLIAFIPTALWFVTGKGDKPDAPIIPPLPQDPAPFVQSFGWTPDPAAVEASNAKSQTPDFRQTPAGMVVRGDLPDVFLYRNLPKDWKNLNQGDVGWCVGAASKHAYDIAHASAIGAGLLSEFKPVCGEAIYAGSRVDILGGRIQGDGSIGSAAKEYMERFGVVSMELHGAYDLRTPSPARAREWGSKGVPQVVADKAKESPVKSIARARSVTDVRTGIAQGYTTFVCSDVGFNGMNRDAQGFIRRSGVWPHCMAFVGIRGGARPGVLCMNSWGDNAHGGARWPDDMPVCCFWIDDATVDQMVRQSDSYVVSGVTGFPAVPLDWFIRARINDHVSINADCVHVRSLLHNATEPRAGIESSRGSCYGIRVRGREAENALVW